MDLTLRVDELHISKTRNYGNTTLSVNLEVVETSDLNTSEIAKHIEFETYFGAHSESDIKQYIKANYDWFDNII